MFESVLFSYFIVLIYNRLDFDHRRAHELVFSEFYSMLDLVYKCCKNNYHYLGSGEERYAVKRAWETANNRRSDDADAFIEPQVR